MQSLKTSPSSWNRMSGRRSSRTRRLWQVACQCFVRSLPLVLLLVWPCTSLSLHLIRTSTQRFLPGYGNYVTSDIVTLTWEKPLGACANQVACAKQVACGSITRDNVSTRRLWLGLQECKVFTKCVVNVIYQTIFTNDFCLFSLTILVMLSLRVSP